MAWNLTDLNRLKAAIATGARSVQYSDKKIEYRSLSDMVQAKRMIEREINGSAQKGSLKSHTPVFRKGL